MLSGPAWRCAFTRSFSIAIHQKQRRDPPSPDVRPSLVRQYPVCGLPEPLSRFAVAAQRAQVRSRSPGGISRSRPAAGAVHPGRLAGRDRAARLRAGSAGAGREHRRRQPSRLRRPHRDAGGRARRPTATRCSSRRARRWRSRRRCTRKRATTRRNFVHIIHLTDTPLALVVHPGVPATTVKEFIAYTHANKGKVNVASTGNATYTHLTIELFKSITGADVTHIPYKGAAPAMNDLLGKQIHALFTATASVQPHTAAGRLKALAVTSPKRSAAMPDVPTFAEAGVKNLVVSVWVGISAPAGAAAGRRPHRRRIRQSAQSAGRARAAAQSRRRTERRNRRGVHAHGTRGCRALGQDRQDRGSEGGVMLKSLSFPYLGAGIHPRSP